MVKLASTCVIFPYKSRKNIKNIYSVDIIETYS